MSIKNVVLIAGVHGVSGRAAAEHWSSLPGTQVYGFSRRSAPLPAGVEAISGDLLDRGDLQRKLGQISGITHIVFGAYIEKPTATERSEVNVTILKNLLDVVEKTSPSLRPLRRPPAKTIRGSCRRTSITTRRTFSVSDNTGRRGIGPRCARKRQPALVSATR